MTRMGHFARNHLWQIYAGLGHNNIVHYLKGSLFGVRSGSITPKYIFHEYFEVEIMFRISQSQFDYRGEKH